MTDYDLNETLPQLHTCKLVFSFVGEFRWLYCVIREPQEKEQNTQNYLHEIPAYPVVFLHSSQAGVILCSKM